MAVYLQSFASYVATLLNVHHCNKYLTTCDACTCTTIEMRPCDACRNVGGLMQPCLWTATHNHQPRGHACAIVVCAIL